MPDNSEIKVKLPVGAKVFQRSSAKPSVEVAEDLARKGASEDLVRAVGGEKAVVKVRRSRANGAPA